MSILKHYFVVYINHKPDYTASTYIEAERYARFMSTMHRNADIVIKRKVGISYGK